jgi:hypothetical protein
MLGTYVWERGGTGDWQEEEEGVGSSDEEGTFEHENVVGSISGSAIVLERFGFGKTSEIQVEDIY